VAGKSTGKMVWPRTYRADIKTEVVEISDIAELERGSRKRCVISKQPSTTLYECDCGEVISRGDLKQGDAVIVGLNRAKSNRDPRKRARSS
jgi:hypothetical protein